MIHKPRFSRRALRQIAEVLRWTRQHFGGHQRDAYAKLIELALAEISRDPELPRSRRSVELHDAARIMPIARVGKPARHFLVYRIESNGRVEIGCFLHERMNLRRHLPKDYLA
jgi:plasmid stabilization system protein ParE